MRLAEPQGYRRPFLDEDEIVLRLLPQVRYAAPELVEQLLVGSGIEGQPPSSVRVQALEEPLSERELEVLGLLVAGLTNREIAERLFISVGTVKTHVHNIYGKLGVSGRPKAIVRAQELNLI